MQIIKVDAETLKAVLKVTARYMDCDKCPCRAKCADTENEAKSCEALIYEALKVRG